MSFSPEFSNLLQDSVKLDFQELIVSGSNYADTLTKLPDEKEIIADTTTKIIQKSDLLVKTPEKIVFNNAVADVDITIELKDTVNTDTTSIQLIKNNKPFDRFYLFKESERSFAYKPFGIFSTERDSVTQKINNIQFEQREFQQSKFSWALIVGFISIFLLLVLKTYYQKFMSQVMNTLVNFQLAEKILREKNIVVRRAFFLLNLNYIIVFSLFLLLIIRMFDFHINDNYFLSYIIVTGSLLLILLTRLILLYLTGIVFNSLPIVSEYIHNIYLINKNLGIILLPLIFTALYTSANISKIALIMGLIIVCIATLFKYIRGLQIIIKNDVLKFYSFLYLCTLELLPIVVSWKIISMLR